MKVFIVNSQTLIGCQLLHALYNQGMDVAVVDRIPKHHGLAIKQFGGNYFSGQMLKDCVEDFSPQVIVHCNELPDEGSFSRLTRESLVVPATVVDLVESDPKYKSIHFIQVSSLEASSQNLNSKSGFCYKLVEQMVELIPNHCIYRLPIVIGKREKPTNDFINTIIFSLLRGEKIETFARRSVVNLAVVEDVVKILIKAIENPTPGLYNVHGVNYELGKLLKSIHKEIGQGKINFNEDVEAIVSYINSDNLIKLKKKLTQSYIQELILWRKTKLKEAGYVET